MRVSSGVDGWMESHTLTQIAARLKPRSAVYSVKISFLLLFLMRGPNKRRTAHNFFERQHNSSVLIL